MIIDVNASLGPYPFRSLRHTRATDFVAHLDRNGISQAVVTSIPAAFYRDTHRGNEELWTETRPHAKRLIPVPTINPRYAGWNHDLAQCSAQWKPRAVALLPEYHGYTLADTQGREALSAIEALGVPVLLRQRFEDRRQRHAWDRAEDLPLPAVLDVARAHPRLKFLLVNCLGLDGRKMADAGLKGRCLLDFARLQVVFRKDVPRLIDALGAEAIAFGSHLPFDYAAASLVKLANVQATRPGDYEAIAWRNAARFLALDV